MSRLRRFSDSRFVGRRDTMIVYDCDDDTEIAALLSGVGADELEQRNLLQAFAPDTLSEAANRGFRVTST